MKKMIVGVLSMLVMAGFVCADSYTYTFVAANCTNTSEVIPISGYLDKIELSQTAGLSTTRSNVIVVATYNGTTAVDTLASVTLGAAKVVRVRVQPTDNTGTVIPAVLGTSITNYSTALNVPYEKVLVGGNIKVTIQNDHANASTNVITFYYEPLKK
jgi:hypothetical protein